MCSCKLQRKTLSKLKWLSSIGYWRGVRSDGHYVRSYLDCLDQWITREWSRKRSIGALRQQREFTNGNPPSATLRSYYRSTYLICLLRYVTYTRRLVLVRCIVTYFHFLYCNDCSKTSSVIQPVLHLIPSSVFSGARLSKVRKYAIEEREDDSSSKLNLGSTARVGKVQEYADEDTRAWVELRINYLNRYVSLNRYAPNYVCRWNGTCREYFQLKIDPW